MNNGKYCKEIREEICRYLEQGMSNRDACFLAGITEETFYQWVKKPEFSEGIRRAAIKCKQRNIAVIQKAGVTADWHASGWWLERKHPDEFALRSKVEVEMKFVMEFTSKVIEAINKTVPDKCPHCKTLLALRAGVARELEQLSSKIDGVPNAV